MHSDVVYDVDGRVLQERDDSLRALLGLERRGIWKRPRRVVNGLLD